MLAEQLVAVLDRPSYRISDADLIQSFELVQFIARNGLDAAAAVADYRNIVVESD